MTASSELLLRTWEGVRLPVQS
ncbi:unnamed protein product [Linum tenue]|uniref:Uncharacterized protein n=1 Tax=Linum tenue TaxID=586396 RepID=A0AAV0RS96_9ROSI|nr:unnamed protein product [Linum tenue]